MLHKVESIIDFLTINNHIYPYYNSACNLAFGVKPINFFTFHLTPNEWDTASTLSDRYFVYRLMISKNSLTIYVLQDPVHMYKKNQISLTIRDGAEITFNAEHCEKTNLKIWKG